MLDDIPIGFGMALSMRPQAMEKFCSLSDQQQQEIIEHTHQIHSREEMSDYVESLVGKI